MDKYYPNGDKTDNQTVYGYSIAQTTVQVLKQCGDDLTRENVMKQAANLHDLALPMLLPGIAINTSATNFAPIKQAQMRRFDGERYYAVRSDPDRRDAAEDKNAGQPSGRSGVILGCGWRLVCRNWDCCEGVRSGSSGGHGRPPGVGLRGSCDGGYRGRSQFCAAAGAGFVRFATPPQPRTTQYRPMRLSC